MAEIIRGLGQGLSGLFINVKCDCGSDDTYACEPDGSSHREGTLSLLRCRICGRIWEIVSPENIEHGGIQVKLYNHIPKSKKYLNELRPRKANKAEKNQLIDWQVQKYAYDIDRETIESWVEDDAFIAVFDDYATTGVGYRGKLMAVVWGGPAWYDVYTWNDDGSLCFHARDDE